MLFANLVSVFETAKFCRTKIWIFQVGPQQAKAKHGRILKINDFQDSFMSL